MVKGRTFEVCSCGVDRKIVGAKTDPACPVSFI